MPKEIKLEKFEGPLDLLLQLIEGEKLAITDISLAEVTEQFFGYLNTLEAERSDELSDFLVIATRLVYIKSRQLLPYLYPADEESGNLAEQLKFYKRYADASKLVEKLWQDKKMAYGRIEPPPPPTGFVLPLNAGLNDLREAFAFLLKRLKPISVLPEIKVERTATIQQKIKEINNLLNKIRSINFREVVENATSRSEVIVCFLAVLELVKQEKASIKQQNAFELFTIHKI